MDFLTILLLILGIILVLIILITIAGTLFFFDYAILAKPENPHPAWEKDSTNPWMIKKTMMDARKKWIRDQNPEEISLTSFDGLALKASFLPAVTPSYNEKGGVKILVLMHGFRASEYGDSCMATPYFHDAGYQVLLPYERCHGKSAGRYICYGIKERYDCKAWTLYCVERFGADCSIVLMGVSMGCATINMTLGLDLPDNVKAAIADCGFTSPYDIFTHVIHETFHCSKFPFFYTTQLLCKWLAGFSFKEYSTLEAMRVNTRPILFIHGEKDTFVPVWMSHKNYEACVAPKELLIVEGAAHAMSFIIEPELCWERIKAFLEKYVS